MADSSSNLPNEFIGWELGLFAPSVSQLTLAETIALLSKMGYKWVEWRVQTHEQIEASPWGKAYNTLVLDHLIDDARQVASLLEGSDIKVAALQVDAPEDFPELQKVVREAAQIIDCSKVLLFSPCFDICTGYKSQKQDFQAQIAKWVAEIANTKVRICLETHFSSITPSTALTMGILEPFSAEQTGVMWDPANMVLEGAEIPALALNLMGFHLAEVHLKNGEWKREEDGKWNFNFCDLSQGIVQWPVVLKMLAEHSYQGPLIVEDYRWMDPEAKLAQARQEYEKALALAMDID
jgi:sugar phosphate isomerase/epimerase